MSYPNRTACDVLEEMRKCCKTKNFSYLPGLIEEMQSMANRMEASLNDKEDYERTRKMKKQAEKELQDIQEELAALKEQRDKIKKKRMML